MNLTHEDQELLKELSEMPKVQLSEKARENMSNLIKLYGSCQSKRRTMMKLTSRSLAGIAVLIALVIGIFNYDLLKFNDITSETVNDPNTKQTPASQSQKSTDKFGDFSGDLEMVGTNQWSTTIDGKLVQVFAGAYKKDPEQGLIDILQEKEDYTEVGTPYPTPTKHGIVKIINEENLKLTVEAKDGTIFVFDLKSKSYISQ